MLTENMLKQNPALQGLTADQISAITTMSKNDENTVIGTKIGALHGQYDSDILTVTGIKKNDGEKSYDYLKRALKANKDEAASVKKDLDAANAKVTDLEDKLAKNAGNEALQQQLKDAKDQVSQLQASLTAKTTELSTKTQEFSKQLTDAKVDFAFSSALSGFKFKEGVTEAVQRAMITAAKAEVLAKGTPEFIEAGGKQTLVFRNAEGQILNNPKTSMSAYTVKELLEESSLKDVLEVGRQQPGGGTQPPGGSSGQQHNSVIDLSGVKSQLEADEAIASYLLQQGYTRDSAEFRDQSVQLRTENNVSELPLR